MTSVTVGKNIDPSPDLYSELSRTEIPDDVSELLNNPNELNALRALIHEEMSAAVADVERRLSQARELERSAAFGEARQVHTEDLNLNMHMIDGYTLTANSPSGGSIAWSGLHVVYLGVDYTITDGNTALKYTWFIKPGSGTSATLTSSNTLPVLGANDSLIFVNNAGTPVSALESSIAYAVGADVIGTSQIIDGAVSGAKTNFYTLLAAGVVAAQAAADAAQATANGAINTYFQASAPWANGARPNDNEVGDVWYDSDDGQAYRWSGVGGSPANTWLPINDSDMGAALTAANNAQAKADIKVTTYNSVFGSPPTAPTPPAGSGFTIGDLWFISGSLGNQINRWNGSNWINVLLGDSALSDIGGAKVGTGINGDNVTTGTVAAARIGAGVNAAALGTATGTVGSSQIATGAVGTTQLAAAAVTPSKINSAIHLLY